MNVYVVGSLRNHQVQVVAAALRAAGHTAYDDWAGAGPEADDRWQEYERQRGRTYVEALQGWHANQVFANDKRHLDRCDAAVLVAPAGRSAHLELGYVVGLGKPGYVLLDGEPERFDVMLRFATGVFYDLDNLVEVLE